MFARSFVARCETLFRGWTTRYLVLDEMQPGDIILSGGVGPSALGIQLFTGSWFSHAAIVIDPLIWFESVGTGIAYLPIRAELQVVNGKLRSLIRFRIWSWLEVVRARDLQHITEEQRTTVLETLLKASGAVLHHEYPTFDTFVNIMKFQFSRLRVVMRWLSPRNVVIPGPFCSELVVTFLRILGLTIFAKKDAKQITPGAIWRSNDFIHLRRHSGRNREIPRRFSSLREWLERNRESIQPILRATSAAADTRRAVVIFDRVSMKLEDKIRADLKAAGQADALRHWSIKRDFDIVLPDPVPLYIPSILRWWSEFRGGQQCSQHCMKAGASLNWNCEELGCWLTRSGLEELRAKTLLSAKASLEMKALSPFLEAQGIKTDNGTND